MTTIDTTAQNDWVNVTLGVQVSEEFSQAFYKNVDQNKPVKATGQVEVKHLGRGIRPEFKAGIIPEALGESLGVEPLDCPFEGGIELSLTR